MNTKSVYRAGIFDFFDCIYGRVRKGRRATREEVKEYEKLAERYFKEDRDHFDDLLRFVAYMNEVPPIGAKAKIAGVKEFLTFYGVEFSQKQLKQLSTKMPKGRTSRTAEKDIDVDMLRRILTHMDLKGKALVLVLASSGMRIGEALQIRLRDVDLATDPARIVVRGEYTKSGDTRTVFISREAKEFVKEWLKLREDYLKSAVNRNKGLVEKAEAGGKTLEDDRLFPFSDRTVREMWKNALKKAGLWNKDDTTGRSQVRIHSLRKFFRSQLALSCPVDIVEALMGHEGYLTEAYRRYTIKQMAEYYKRAEHLVTISMPKEIAEIETEFKEELNKNRKLIEDLILENRELKEEIERIKEQWVIVLDAIKTDPEAVKRKIEEIEGKN